MTDFLLAESGIRQLLARSVDATSRKDAAEFAACFAPDGEWKIAGMHMRGQAEIAATFAKLLGLCERVTSIISAPILTVEQGTAFGRTHVWENAKLMSGQTAHTTGIYYDRFVAQSGLWKFQSRHWSLIYRGPVDLSGTFYNSPDYGPHPGMPAADEPTTVKRPE